MIFHLRRVRNLTKRIYTLNRWNWSEQAGRRSGRWVYIELDKNGKRTYTYQLEPPEEFVDLTMELKKINEKLMQTEDPEENTNLFKEMIKISDKMQAMRKGAE